MSVVKTFSKETAKGWVEDASYNLDFLRDQEKYANMLLKAQGYLILREVYDLLGLKYDDVSALRGWIYDPYNLRFNNRVDFGITERDGFFELEFNEDSTTDEILSYPFKTRGA